MSQRQPAFRPKWCDACGEEFEPRSGRQRWCTPGGCTKDPEIASTLVEVEPEPEVGARPSENALVEQVAVAVRLNAEALRGGRGFRDPAWQFVAELKKLPEWAGISEDEAVERCEWAFNLLYRRGNGKGSELPFSTGYSADQSAWMKRRLQEANNRGWICALGVVDSYTDLTQADPGEDFIDPLQAFLRAWRNVRAEPSAFDAAEYRAQHPGYQEPKVFGEEIAAPRRAPYRHFLAVCREMSRAAEDGVFHLPTRFWADRLNTDRRTLAGWRRESVERGFLELVERESGHGGHLARAARYRWSGP